MDNDKGLLYKLRNGLRRIEFGLMYKKREALASLFLKS